MIASVTNLAGHLTGAHRTWLDPSGFPRGDARQGADRHPTTGDGRSARSRGTIRRGGRGHGGWRRHRDHAVARSSCPTMPMVAALSAAHLSAILFPDTLRRLYIARDDDPAGDGAMATLIDRAQEAGIEAIVISPTLRRLQRGSPPARRGCPSGGAAGCRSRRRTSPASWSWRHSRNGDEGSARRRRHGEAGGHASLRAGEDRAHGLLRGRSGGKRPGPAMAGPTIFRRRPRPPFHRETK